MIQLLIDNPVENGVPKVPPDRLPELADEILQLLIDLTPVDTGFCQASWQPWRISGNTLIFVNDCDYAQYLDRGWSKQAPDGMTRPVLQQLPDLVSSYI